MRSNTRRHILAAALLGLLAAVASTAAPAGQLLEERDFRLDKTGRDRVVLSIPEPGTLVIKVRIKEPFPTTPVHLLLEGPGGLRVEKKGAAPLRLRYQVSAAAAKGSWHASVINVSKMADVAGKLTVELRDPKPGAQAPAAPSATGAGAGAAVAAEGSEAVGAGETGEAGEAAGTSGAVSGAREVAAAAPPAPMGGGDDSTAAEADLTDGRVSYIDDRRLRAVCRDRNTDVSVRLDLEQGTGVLLLRSNHVSSFAARELSGEKIELRGSGRHSLVLDLARQALLFTSGEEGTFCRVRIYRHGERGGR